MEILRGKKSLKERKKEKKDGRKEGRRTALAAKKILSKICLGRWQWAYHNLQWMRLKIQK